MRWYFEDQAIGEFMQKMGGGHIRTMPVLSRDMELAGVVSLGDLVIR